MRIIVGVSGGVAAYKAATLVSTLVQRGHEVQVLLTPGATQFISPLTFSALSQHAVGVETSDQPMGPISHVQLAKWADVMVVVPATLGVLARLATGIASDLLCLTYLSFAGPVIVAPAMEPQMWAHPRTQSHYETLRHDGVRFCGPVAGHLASGAEGLGRLVDLEIVIGEIEHIHSHQLEGRRVLITGGATWEHFDPVRALTNPSTGRMGFLLTQEALYRGADVTYIHGPRGDQFGPLPDRVQRVPIVSADDMKKAVWEHIEEADIYVSSAAISDFKPKVTAHEKLHKGAIDPSWPMELNPDILQEVGGRYRGEKFLVGFAAETDAVIESAQRKLAQKHLDLVVANRVGRSEGFGDGTYSAFLVDSLGGRQAIETSNKEDAVAIIWDHIEMLYGERHGR